MESNSIIKLLLAVIFITVTMSGFIFGMSMDDESENITLYFFWGDGCPHCAEQKPFLEELQNNYPDLNIEMYETWKNHDNAKLFEKMAKDYGTTARGVPTTFIGDKYWVGFAESMKPEIENQVKKIIENNSKIISIVTAEQKTNSEIINNSNNLCVHTFVDETCSECDETKVFINSLNLEDVDVIYHNINDNEEKIIYEKFKETYGLKSAGYPTVFIGDTYLIGINSIKKNFEDIVHKCQNTNCPCPSSMIKGITPSMPKGGDFKSEKTDAMNIPLVGEVDLGKMPLFVMTGLISFVDGFNPCSLWVLTFLLGIVIYTGSRKKIFLVGLTFLLVTSTTYGLFMLGLLNVFTYVSYTLWIKVLVAVIATIFAVVNIKDYFWYKKGISFTISDKHKPKLFKQVRDLMNPNRSTASMLFATAVMALGIVLVELPCTAGFPMIWTNIVAQHNVSTTMFIALFLTYMIIYLIDEIVVFASVILTLKASKFEEKHGRILKLIGGMIMLALAFALVFLPDVMNSVLGSIYVFVIATILSFIIMFVHRRILPKYGIKIGTEALEYKDLNDKKTYNEYKNSNNKKENKKRGAKK